MSHLDSSALATYNSLVDPHLQCYFSGERIRTHLRHAGLIGRRGEIISDSEYRMKLVRREHKRHVRQMLAENIVHRAIDMERARQAELRRQLDIVAKAALVNSIKESRRRFGYPGGNEHGSLDIDGQSPQPSWSRHRPRSASHNQDLKILNEELADRTRVHSAHNQHQKYSSKSPVRRSRYLNRPKSMNIQRSSSMQQPRSPTKSSEPLCQIKMIYYGPHTKIDYDHSLFAPVDEIIVMQQHCGGENLIVYKNRLEAEKEFEFTSRRHADYPFGLSLYINGLIDSRISTCCEYKHRHGVRLGGERGHFAIISVEGSKPCLKCRLSKQAQLKEYGESNDGDEENAKPITISIPVSEQPRHKQTPVKIPVRNRSDSNEKYSDDFNESDKSKLDQTESKSPTSTSSTSTIQSNDKNLKKTWQINFYTSNIPMGSFNPPKNPSSTAVLKFSFISVDDDDDETEQHIIQMKDFPQAFKSSRQDSFRIELRDIGKPKQIRLIIEVNGQEKNEDIKWHLDYIDVIDPKTQVHYKFPCNQWIRPSEEKLLNNSEFIRKASTSTSSSKSSNSKKQSSKIETKSKSSSRSSSSSYDVPKRFELIKKPISNEIRRVSSDVESTDSNKVHYRITIYPSNETNGEFDALNNSRIFLRLNNQTKDSILYKKGSKTCPSFQSGIEQTFEIDLRQNENEKPTKLTIGYYNTDISAGKWKLEKIILVNTQTNEQTIFLCQRALVRNDFNLRAEQAFEAQSRQSTDDDDDEQSTPRNPPPVIKHIRSSMSSNDEKAHQITTKKNHNQSESDGENSSATETKKQSHIRQSSPTSTESSGKDKNSSSRPKTRRGRDENPTKNLDSTNSKPDTQTNPEVWRSSSEVQKDSVDPLVGLEDLQNQTGRSNERKPSSTPSDATEGHFKDWYRKNNDDDDDDEN